MATKATLEIATIDVEMFTFAEADGTEYLLKSASEITVAPEIEEREATKLIVKDRLIAQKRGSKTITGNTITLTDNVFSPELVLQLQGGEITYSDPGTNSKIASYTPPLSGSDVKPKTFTGKAYSAVYDAAGEIVNYECIEYPNCQGSPIEFSRKDGEFSVATYTITSAPNKSQPPYKITYVDALPVVG